MCVWSTHVNISSQKPLVVLLLDSPLQRFETRVHLRKGYATSNNPTKYLAWPTERIFFVLLYEFRHFNTVTRLTSNRLCEVPDTGGPVITV